MKEIRTVDAVGQVLCHDITQIVKDVKKGVLFKKGHVIEKEDIPLLLSVGKDHVYVWENDDSMLHENDAAEILCRICKGDHIERGDVSEGKIELFAACDGVFQINRERLARVNAYGEMMIAARHGDFVVKKGDKLAGTRIIPLVIEKKKMEDVERLAGNQPVMNVVPFQEKKVGIVTTGNEIYYGRIEDTFTPVVVEKIREFGGRVISHKKSGDQAEHIEKAICETLGQGAEMVICTGGMSVDPDDKTPLAIRRASGQVITYGAPVLPGAMFMLAYYGEKKIPVMGLPGCVMYAKRTIFDLVLPRLMVGEILEKKDFDRLGEGGLCLNCDICTFPNCGFGKGR